jgi:hypothetical protein
MEQHDSSQWAGAANQDLSRRLRALWSIITTPAPLATEQGDEELLNRLTICTTRPHRIQRRCRFKS